MEQMAVVLVTGERLAHLMAGGIAGSLGYTLARELPEEGTPPGVVVHGEVASPALKALATHHVHIGGDAPEQQGSIPILVLREPSDPFIAPQELDKPEEERSPSGMQRVVDEAVEWLLTQGVAAQR